MTAPSQDARAAYPDNVTDRSPDTSYSFAAWLEPRPLPQDDWLAAAFGLGGLGDPGITGRFRVRRGF
jgi:hypothetical protein